MPRLTEARQQSRREQIVQAPLRCFARRGLADTSMADIIAEAGSRRVRSIRTSRASRSCCDSWSPTCSSPGSRLSSTTSEPIPGTRT